MHTVFESLPFFKSYSPVSETAFFKRLNTVKHGKFAQRILIQCEAGMSPADFDKLTRRANFKKAIAALEKVHEKPTRDRIVGSLRSTATTFYWLKKHDGRIPWEAYAKRFRCLNLPHMEPAECRSQMLPCNSVLTRCFGSVLETILFRHEMLSKENGFSPSGLSLPLNSAFHFAASKGHWTSICPWQ